MTNPYSKLLVDHFRRPRNRGTMAHPTISEEGVNRLCGDRVRIDHAIFLTDELICRLGDLGVPVVGQPSFLYDVGGGRLPSVDLRRRAFASLGRAGVRQAFSSDYPCSSLPPLVGIYAAVTRRTEDGALEAPEEAMSASDALAAYTIGAARATGQAASS